MDWDGSVSRWSSVEHIGLQHRGPHDGRVAARACSRVRAGRTTRTWLHTLALLTCSTLAAACGEPAEEGDEAPTRLAQTSRAPATEAPDQTVVVQTKQRVPITLKGGLGRGCEGTLRVNEFAASSGVLQVFFEKYGLKFLPSTLSYDSIECDLELRVSGARGFRYAVQRVDFVGMAFLPSTRAEARFMTTLWWSGRGPEQTKEPKVIRGEWMKHWNHSLVFELEESGQSRCFTGSQDVDEITLKTTLTLFNPETTLPAEVRLDNLITEASGSTIPQAEAAMNVEFSAAPCTPEAAR